MLKKRSWIPITVLSIVLLIIEIGTTILSPINTLGYFAGSLLSPFIIVSLVSRKTHWTGKQQITRILILGIIFQIFLQLPLQTPKALISLISIIAFIGLVIAIIIELFQKRGIK